MFVKLSVTALSYIYSNYVCTVYGKVIHIRSLNLRVRNPQCLQAILCSFICLGSVSFVSRPQGTEGNSHNSHVVSIASPLSGLQPARPTYKPPLPIHAVCRKEKCVRSRNRVDRRKLGIDELTWSV